MARIARIRRVIICGAATLLVSCQGASTTTPAPTQAPIPATTAALASEPAASRSSLPSSSPTSSPQPTKSAVPTSTPEATATASPAAVVSAIDGAYLASFTKDDLAASPLLYDQGEVNDENWGTWTLTLDEGIVYYWQGNEVTNSGSDGTFSVDGDAVTMRFLRGSNAGETFGFRWSLDGGSLTFHRDESVGTGPTPFLVSTWTKTGGSETIPWPCCGPTLLPRTYRTTLNPPLTFTVSHEVDLDCARGFVCRGDVDAGFPYWLDMEFGNEHGSELSVISMRHVPGFTPAKGLAAKSPAEFVAWLTSQPNATVIDGPTDVQVGNRSGVQADLYLGDGVTFGATEFPDVPNLSVGPRTRARISATETDGTLVLIVGLIGSENVDHDFNAAVGGLQPLLDSMMWRLN